MGGYSQSVPDAGAGAGGANPSAPNPGNSGGQGGQGAGPSNPALRNALNFITTMAKQAEQYARAYPQCANEMRQVGELLQKCMMKTTQAQQAPEPATPPV